MRRNLATIATLAAGCWLLGTAARACTAPVFRYALERWTSDAYGLVVFHRGEFSRADRSLVACLSTNTDGFGLEVEMIDVAGPVPDRALASWEQVRTRPLPCAALVFPSALAATTPVLWRDTIAEETIGRLLRDVYSPLARKICSCLVGGDTAVWLLFRTGRKTDDERAESLLVDTLNELETALKLPHELDPNDAAYDMAVAATIPLHIRFTVLGVAPDSPGRPFLLNTLAPLRGQDPGAAPTSPLVVPVFARCRALAALTGEELTAETIAEIARFLAGPCACKVKDLHPGMDLFIPFPWEDILYGDVTVEQALARVAAVMARFEPGGPAAAGKRDGRTLPRCAILLGCLAALAVLASVILARWSRKRRAGRTC
ncbi:MAG: hypothetical protein JXR37_16610 [Kiritimatiellae bacterium]|nr:hypothetical protein [Kiritimatiellia bacterium]